MLKSLPVGFAALLVVAGCVNVAPSASSAPITTASAGPSLGVTTPAPATPAVTIAATPTPGATLAPTPTAPQTPAPTVPASAAMTPAPTLEATLPPSEEPTPVTSGEPATRDLLFSDDMSDPSSGWQTLDQDFATISYDSGVLAMRYNNSGSWAYSIRQIFAPNTTLVEAAEFTPESAGIFGLMCGSSSAAKNFGAVVSTDGGLIFLEAENGTVNPIGRKDNLGLDVAIGQTTAMAIECSVTIDGVVSIIVGLPGTGPLAVSSKPGGVFSFDVSGVYGEASSDGYTLAVDNTAVYGVGGSDGTMSDGAQTLFAHIPTELQQGCYESPIWNTNATFTVTCILQSEGKGPEIAQYHQYADADAMNAGYADLVNAFGVDSAGSCQSGPDETGWDIGTQPGGRVQCAPQTVGIRFDWTEDLTSILSALIDFDGSYKDTFDTWQNAGPIIPQG